MHEIVCRENETLLEGLRKENIGIRAACNGKHSCGRCKVRVLNSDGEITKKERSILSEEELESDIRLACFVASDKEKTYLFEIIDDNDSPDILTQTDILANNKDYTGTDISFAAIDIGTTTIAAKVIKDGEIIYTNSVLNSQASYGADVISRSEASIDGETEELKECLNRDINSLIDNFPVKIDRLILAGNTTIIHLLKGYPLNEMVNYPFTPYYSGWHKEMFIATRDEIPCTIMPNFTAYIGGDVVSGLYYCDFHKNDDVCMFIDLGTNGEMAIGNKDRILTASAAAGPAFEGTRLNVATDVVECIAKMKADKIIDENGVLVEQYFDKGYPYPLKDGITSVRITQRDIRNIQMAKSAIRSGLSILIKRYGIDINDIKKLYLAGGMGHTLDVKSAAYIGLIPDELKDKSFAVGNSSLAGLIKYGLEDYNDEAINSILNVCEEAVLSNEEDFSTLYFQNMKI